MKKKLCFLFYLLICTICFTGHAELTKNELAIVNSLVNLYKEKKPINELSTFIEISPKAYKNNISYIKKLVGPDVKVCLVMKGDAYGHGLKNLIDAAVESKPDYIAAIENRDLKLLAEKIKEEKADIHLLRLAPPLLTEVVSSQLNDYKIEEIVGSLGEGEMLSSVATVLSEKLGREVIIPIHINVETGMGRMGVRKVEDIKKIMKLKGLKLKGIMTHFAKVYEMEKGLKMTKEQTKKYDEVVSQLDLDKSVIRHIANSGATAMYPWTRKDMVRVGSLTYGEDIEGQDPEHKLKPVFTGFKSYVCIIERDIPPNSPIGYDSAQRTSPDRKSTTATVRIGYNNVYPFENAYEEDTKVMIKGKLYPLIGKTSMNMIVVDITDEDKNNPIELEDEVTVINTDKKSGLSIYDIAKKNKIGVVEILLAIGKDNPKINID